jgi:orotate phosphoribosyltransferase-like protein
MNRNEELIEDAAWLHHGGESPEHIAQRLGVSLEALTRALYRRHHPLSAVFSAAIHEERKRKRAGVL